MTTDWELGFADECGQYFARLHGLAPMTGRVVGWLLVCDPPDPTIADVAVRLRASRTAVTQSAAVLADWSWIVRSRAAGERVDRIRLDAEMWARLIDNPIEYTTLGALAARGLAALGDAPHERRARLIELAEFTEFVAARMPALAAEWRVQVDDLRARGHAMPRRRGPRKGAR